MWDRLGRKVGHFRKIKWDTLGNWDKDIFYFMCMRARTLLIIRRAPLFLLIREPIALLNYLP